MNLPAYLKKQSALVDRALDRLLPSASLKPSRLHRAMRYSVLSGGKRVRPIVALAAAEAVGGRSLDVLDAACAIELIHNYSLIHDDLPSMDDDDLRRGRPTCHVRFDEATAILAGDALLTLAFEILTRPSKRKSERRLETARRIAHAAGGAGMVGGQVLDMEYQGKLPAIGILKDIHSRKSGALIAVSAEAGAYLGGGSQAQVGAIGRYGKALGLLFQIVDDILDNEGYAKAVGEAKAKTHARQTLEEAKKALRPLGKRAAALAALADFVLTRTY